MTGGSRRLAAIMFTDLVGFTRLGQRNEERALELRREHQALVRPLFAAHGGREVKTMGDGFLVEFPSAVESVRCAVAVQGTVRERNARAPGEPLSLRIGIHLGEVVEEGNDIVGDAVNVASRIEPIAEPGGVCLSGPVFEQVRNKLPVSFEKLSPRRLKNVEEPLELYRLVLDGGARRPSAAPDESSRTVRLAVLPFANLSPDPGDEYFADGLTDELISQVSRLPTLRVIARTSVQRYKGTTQPIRAIAQELGIRLALEGSVRKAADRIRVTVQLVDSDSEEHLWSGRYERPLQDIFSIQDEIAGQVAASISDHLARLGVREVAAIVHASPETSDLEAYTQFLRGRRLLAEKGSVESIRQALAHFEAAVARDPRFSRARVGIAESLLWLASEGLTPYAAATERARAELARALALDERLAEAHSVLASLMLGEDDLAGCEREARRARELNPSLSDPYRWLAQLEAGAGRIEEAVRLLETAQQLDPVDVNVVAFLGRAYLYAGREADALAHWARTEPLVAFRTNAHRAEYFLSRGEIGPASDALRAMERARPGSPWVEVYRGWIAARTGDEAGARAVIARLEERARTGELTVLFQGYVQFALDDEDAFVRCMEESSRLHALPLLELMYSPLYAAARRDPRILDLLRKQSELRSPRP